MRISSLTGLRGIAAIAVMLYHIPQAEIFRPYEISLFSRGYLCVDLFFVLSGFVISYGYYDRVMSTFSLTSYSDFLVNRVARVFPLHAVVALIFFLKLTINFSAQKLTDITAWDLLANLLMIQSWGLGTHAIAGNSWSVSTEMVAYIFFPLIALAVFSRAALLALLCSIASLWCVVQFGNGVEGPMDVVDRSSLLPVLRCLAGFTLGVIAYRISLREWCRTIFSGNLAFACALLLFLAAFLVPGGDILVVLSCPLLVIACAYDSPLARAIMANPVSFHLGVISYSIYLWHPMFRDIAARIATMLEQHGIMGFTPLIVVAMLIFTWAACWASYSIIEVHGHKIIKALQNRFKQRPIALTAEQ